MPRHRAFARIITFLPAIAAALLVSSVVTAVAQLPAFYHGVVTITGPERSQPALPGSKVTTRVAGKDATYDPTTVGMAGRYGGSPDDRLLVQDPPDYTISRGETIEFYVNDVKAQETSNFDSGSIKEMNLTVPDSEGPTAPSGLQITTPKKINKPSFSWSPSTDNLSGIQSYGVSLDSGPLQWLSNAPNWTATDAVSDGKHSLSVKAKDGVGNVGNAATLDFEVDTALPAAFDIKVMKVQEASAIITWSTNKPVLSWLDYSVTANNYPWTVGGAASPNTGHAVTITGLLAGTTYHYRVRIKDAMGNSYSSDDLIFTTLSPSGPGTTPLDTVTVTVTPIPKTTLPGQTSPPGSTTQPPPPVAQRVMDDKGVMLLSMVLASEDKKARVEISEGTRALDASGNPLPQVAIKLVTQPPQLLGGAVLVAYDFQPEDASFSPPVKVTLAYDPAAIPSGYTEAALQVGYYDKAKTAWTLVPSIVDTKGHTVSALVNRFSMFGLVVQSERTTTAPIGDGPSFIDRLITKAIIAGASLIAFIAALITLVVIVRMRHKRIG
ncbi:MAG: fibronectin type III domain-containing protein [Chloroflexi bacterium]|nr:fibronectin type III domain-containing protein [Chloroflexota bacterium]